MRDPRATNAALIAMQAATDAMERELAKLHAEGIQVCGTCALMDTAALLVVSALDLDISPDDRDALADEVRAAIDDVCKPADGTETH